MSHSLQQLFSFSLALVSFTFILPVESPAREVRSWEGSIILTRDTGASTSRSYKRWLREQRRLERKFEREQIREAKRQARRYSHGSDYYPVYRYGNNPVVSTDEYDEGGYAPDGTYHCEEVTEDRHQSYYSPGRQEAVTPPNTTQDTWTYGDGTVKSREKTSWIGSDGQYHSSTINRTTQTDEDGNTCTQTHVDLKRQSAASSASSGSTTSPAPSTSANAQTSETIPATSQPETSSQTQADTTASAPAQASSSSTGPAESSASTEPTPKPTGTESETPPAAPEVSQ